MSAPHVAAILESLLFVSGEPLSFVRLAKLIGTDEKNVIAHTQALAEKYVHDEQSGLMLIVKDGKAVLVAKPENTQFVEALTKSSLQENLSRAALEVLAIVAYRSPITRSEIEAIRGVNCSFTLRNLLLRDLIERRDNPADAREYVYYATFHFLQSLGLQGMENLPDYATLSQDERLRMILDPSETLEAESTGQEPTIESKKETEK